MDEKTVQGKIVRRAEFLIPGTFVSESFTRAVGLGGPEAVEFPGNNVFAFRFITGVEFPVDGSTEFHATKRESETHYFGGMIYTPAELRRDFPEEKILIGNVERNGGKKPRAILTRTGGWKMFYDGDTLLPEPTQ